MDIERRIAGGGLNHDHRLCRPVRSGGSHWRARLNPLGKPLTGRAVKEWIGKTPDTPAPPRVKLRIFQNCGGVCHISSRKIAQGEPWELEHVKPLHAGGENREGNLRPALVDPHKEKTKREMEAKAKSDAAAKFSLGIKPAHTVKIPSRGKPAKAPSRFDRTPLEPRRLYK